ncbi:hypothetical protein [Methanolacinia petrolearia]|uniref:hypothetical protein n=1 Tax=Methanolacinia petrolearia TaxID=54120 RepID=UPI003BAB3C07
MEIISEEPAINANDNKKINSLSSAALTIKNNLLKMNSGNTGQVKDSNEKKTSSFSQKLGLKSKKDSNEEKKAEEGQPEVNDKKNSSASLKFSLKTKKNSKEEKK